MTPPPEGPPIIFRSSGVIIMSPPPDPESPPPPPSPPSSSPPSPGVTGLIISLLVPGGYFSHLPSPLLITVQSFGAQVLLSPPRSPLGPGKYPDPGSSIITLLIRFVGTPPSPVPPSGSISTLTLLPLPLPQLSDISTNGAFEYPIPGAIKSTPRRSPAALTIALPLPPDPPPPQKVT